MRRSLPGTTPFRLGLLSAIVAFALACAARYQPAPPPIPAHEQFVLPDRYEGPFIAVYGQTKLTPVKWTGDTAVYQVPRDGVVRIRGEEPPHATTTSFVFEARPKTNLRNFPTCADMRAAPRDTEVKVCWLDYSVGWPGVPEHVVAVITNWDHVPENFERTAALYDSVVHKSTGRALRKWIEPKPIMRSPTREDTTAVRLEALRSSGAKYPEQLDRPRFSADTAWIWYHAGISSFKMRFEKRQRAWVYVRTDAASIK